MTWIDICTHVYTHTHGLSEYLVLSNQFGGSPLGKMDFIAQHALISCGVPSRGGPCEISPSSVACQLMLSLLRPPLGGHIFAVSCLIWKISPPTKLPVLLAHGLVTCSLPPPPVTGHFLVSHSTKALSSPAHRSSAMTTDTPGRSTELCRPSSFFCSHWLLMRQRLPQLWPLPPFRALMCREWLLGIPILTYVKTDATAGANEIPSANYQQA